MLFSEEGRHQSGRTLFSSRAASDAAISALTALLLVSRKAASSGVRHVLLDVANVVENMRDGGPVVNRVRADRAGAVHDGAASFIVVSIADN